MRLGPHACGPDRAARPCRLLDYLVGACQQCRRHDERDLGERTLRNIGLWQFHCGLMPANLSTLPHFSVSSAIIFASSAGDPVSGSPPRSARRAFILGSWRAALTSLLSLSTISAGVTFGAPTPNQPLAS